MGRRHAPIKPHRTRLSRIGARHIADKPPSGAAKKRASPPIGRSLSLTAMKSPMKISPSLHDVISAAHSGRIGCSRRMGMAAP